MNNIVSKKEMLEKELSYKEREKRFNKLIVSEYLKYGSVDAVFRENKYDLPVSYPQVHRILDKWGIVKSVGPNSKLSEAICFMILLSDRKISVEKLYKNLPPSFKTSLATMHRILHCIKEGMVRRAGSALLITPEDNPQKILVGEDISTPRLELGKPFGSLSLPMGFSKQDENPKLSILRILQQEVFSKNAVEGNFPYEFIPKSPKPFMFVDVADIRVSVFRLILPKRISSVNLFSSYKLRNFRYLGLSELSKGNPAFRTGLSEIGAGYADYLNKSKKNCLYSPVYLKSGVNLQLARLAFEYFGE